MDSYFDQVRRCASSDSFLFNVHSKKPTGDYLHGRSRSSITGDSLSDRIDALGPSFSMESLHSNTTTTDTSFGSMDSTEGLSLDEYGFEDFYWSDAFIELLDEPENLKKWESLSNLFTDFNRMAGCFCLFVIRCFVMCVNFFLKFLSFSFIFCLFVRVVVVVVVVFLFSIACFSFSFFFCLEFCFVCFVCLLVFFIFFFVFVLLFLLLLLFVFFVAFVLLIIFFVVVGLFFVLIFLFCFVLPFVLFCFLLFFLSSGVE